MSPLDPTHPENADEGSDAFSAGGLSFGGDPRLDTRLLHAAVEGELSLAQAAEFEKTLAADPDLARLVGDLRAQRETMRNLPVAVLPEGFRSAGAARLERAVLLDDPVDADAIPPRAGRAGRGRIHGWQSPARWLAAAAAVGGVVALGLYATGVGDDRPTLADMADRLRVAEAAIQADAPAPREAPDEAAARAPVEPQATAETAPEPTTEMALSTAEADVAAGLSEEPPPGLEGLNGLEGLEGSTVARAETGGLEAFLLPTGGDAQTGPAPARLVAVPDRAQARAGASFQMNLLDDLSRGSRAEVPAWARSETYFQLPRTVTPKP